MQKPSNNKIAKNYACAWADAANEKGCLDTVFSEVCAIKKSIENDKKLWSFLFAFKTNKDAQHTIIKELSKKIKLSNISSEALNLFSENGKLSILALILDNFINYYYSLKNIIPVNVETVIPLTDKQDKKLKSVLENKLKSNVVLIYKINPQILGGLSVSYNSVRLDDTLRGKINRIEQQLYSNDKNV